jgi:Uma2 family endonuclease
MDTSVRFTYSDLEQFPEDGKRREVIGGELTTLPSPSPEHQEVVGNFFFALKSFLRHTPLGRVFVAPIDVIFRIDDVIIPDVVFIARERTDMITKRGLEGAPDLVVEVLSPSSVKRDLEVKRKLCQREGVKVYIAVEPEKERVHLWDLGKVSIVSVGEIMRCSVLPGFELAVEDLFVK